MQKRLGVFLLSYKRPALVKEAIESILAQDFPDFDLIISENSGDDSVVDVIRDYTNYSNVIVVRRKPSLPQLEHFNAILSESKKYDYVMMFHDDDILMPSALSKMMAALETNPNVSAVSCNAYKILDTVHTKTLFNPNLKSPVTISSQSELINRYIIKRLSHTAFPSYIYRTKSLSGLRLEPADGGKYSDVSFLVKLIARGPFFWLSEPLMKYRLHPQNDSTELNLSQIYSLSGFFYKASPNMLPKIIFYYLKQVAKKILLFLGF